MKKQRRRTKAKHGKGRQINWQLVALALVAAVGLVKLWEAASRWQAQQAAFQEQSALQEPDELFRPDVGDPPYTIAVDAGHGGDDPGATGVVVERDMTAATAEALTRWLDADPNYIPAATRCCCPSTGIRLPPRPPGLNVTPLRRGAPGTGKASISPTCWRMGWRRRGLLCGDSMGSATFTMRTARKS